MKSCLIVDDGPLDREMLKRCASAAGFNVREARTGEEAIGACKETLPDCILLDWEMKPMNGIQTLQQLRGLEGGSATCILICTANEHPSFIGHAYLNHADGYIVKPVTLDKLTSKLTELKRLP